MVFYLGLIYLLATLFVKMQEAEVLRQQLDVKQQLLSAIETRLEASTKALAALVAAAAAAFDVPVEVQQALLSGAEAEQRIAADRIPTLVSRLHKNPTSGHQCYGQNWLAMEADISLWVSVHAAFDFRVPIVFPAWGFEGKRKKISIS